MDCSQLIYFDVFLSRLKAGFVPIQSDSVIGRSYFEVAVNKPQQKNMDELIELIVEKFGKIGAPSEIQSMYDSLGETIVQRGYHFSFYLATRMFRHYEEIVEAAEQRWLRDQQHTKNDPPHT